MSTPEGEPASAGSSESLDSGRRRASEDVSAASKRSQSLAAKLLERRRASAGANVKYKQYFCLVEGNKQCARQEFRLVFAANCGQEKTESGQALERRLRVIKANYML